MSFNTSFAGGISISDMSILLLRLSELLVVIRVEHQNDFEDLGQVVSSPWAMPFEQRMHIFLCRDLKISVRELWPRVKNWL
jgi:hypothetical protein